MEVKNIGVIGAGQMGAGIAQVCAAISKKVILCDIKQEFVDNGLKNNKQESRKKCYQRENRSGRYGHDSRQYSNYSGTERLE
jgi:3-hydroxybutyryl-CoA dehydrogenase